MTTPINPDVFLNLFPPHERESIRSVLLSPNGTDGESRLDRILEAIPETLEMKVASNTGKISSQEHNEMLRGLQADLLRLFQIYGELDQAAASHERRSRSLVSDLKWRLSALEDRVTHLERWVEKSEGEGAPIIIDARRTLPRDERARDGETGALVGEANYAKQDIAVGEVVLPIASDNDRIRSKAGGQTSHLVWISQAGGLPLEGDTNLEFALDGREDTAWWARHISMAPVRDPEATGIEEGVSCVLDLVFESTGPLTELIITPFGPMGVEILKVECFERETDSEPIQPLWVGNQDISPKPLRGPIAATEPIRLSGFGESVQRVRLTLGQRHFRIREIPREELQDIVEKGALPDPSITQWAESRGLSVPTDDGDENQNERVVVYEYLYGIKNIKALARTYRPRGVIVTEPIRTARHLEEVSLQISHEPIESKDESGVRSSIRFYILAYGRAIPILPRIVNGEKNLRVENIPVEFKGLGVGKVPFPIDTSRSSEFKLYEEDQLIHPAHYTLGSDHVIYTNYRPELRYWASYVVPDTVENGTFVDLTRLGLTPQEHIERFPPSFDVSSSGGRVIELSRDPYIDINRIKDPDFDPNGSYRPIEVTLIGSFPHTSLNQIRIEDPRGMDDPSNPEEPYVSNQTDYLTGIRRMLIPYSEERRIYSFRQDGRKLYFADPLEGITVEVRYQTLVDSIRIAAVMERRADASPTETHRLREIIVRPRYSI